MRLDPRVRIPYTVQYSFGVERQLAKSTTLNVSYLGSRGISLFRSRDLNAPAAPDYLARPDANISVLRQIESSGRQEGQSLEVSLRGSVNFQTPSGWDTVYTPVFNMIERPIAPMLIVRVETDWYPHETEFRYVLQPGEGITASHSMPIGQVFFVPREDVTFRDCTSDEIAAIKQSAEQFSRDKAAHKVQTPYGMPYSPHYLKQSRAGKK